MPKSKQEKTIEKAPHTEEQKQTQLVVNFVVARHSMEFRKNGISPYVTHCFDVFNMLVNWGVRSFPILYAGLGHDLRENTKTTYEEIVTVMGKEAADYIEELTFIPNLTLAASQSRQKEDYMESFSKKSIGSNVIKLADRCCNTLDFWHSRDAKDVKYARIYWDKATPLFNQLVLRESDFKIFDSDVTTNMKYTKDLVQRNFV